MASMIQTFYVTDNYINTTIYDDSIVIPTDPILPMRMQILQAIFSGKGLANKIIDFSSTSLVKSTYGFDMENLEKYGQGGINVLHGMQGGSAAQICRLLPDDAEPASMLVSVEITPKNDIPIYQRGNNGNFKYEEDTDGNLKKIPVRDESALGGTKPVVLGKGCQLKLLVEPVDPLYKGQIVRYGRTAPKDGETNPEWTDYVNAKATAIAAFTTKWETDHPVIDLATFIAQTFSNLPQQEFTHDGVTITLGVEPPPSPRPNGWEAAVLQFNDTVDIDGTECRRARLQAEAVAAFTARYGTLDDPDCPDQFDYSTAEPSKIVGGIVPLFRIRYYGPGKCGNDFGIRLTNDYERDNQVYDGRRYKLEFYQRDILGNAVSYGQPVYFAMNPKAELVQGTGTYENLEVVYPNLTADGKEKEIQITPFINKNYDTLMEILSNYVDGTDYNLKPFALNSNDPDRELTDPRDLDFINGTTKTGLPYNKIYIFEGGEDPQINWDKDFVGKTINKLTYYEPVQVEDNGIPQFNNDEVIDFRDQIKFLMGGHDGSMELGRKLPRNTKFTPLGTNTVETPTHVTQDYIEWYKDTLLIKFFNGKVDPAIYDERMVDSDIYFDANYTFATVKQTMLGHFREIRPDIMVVADIGETAHIGAAILMVKTIYGYVNGPTAWSAAVITQFGTTTDRAVPIRLSATYDYAYGLAKCFSNFGTFSVFAGYQSGKVTTMRFDWMPYKDEEDTMIGPLRKLGCIFAFKLDKQGTVAYMAEENMYFEEFSKLKSFRNGMIIGDAVRLAKKVLIKYVYDNEGAEGAIRKATAELQETVMGRYPGNIGVSMVLYRTERDKLLDTSSCDINYEFPGMTKSWTLNIHARRAAA